MESSRDNIMVFDKADFLARVEGDMELAGQVIELFCQDAAENMEKIRGAIAGKVMTAVGRDANSLKGASANLSGMRVQRAAEDLEEAAKREQTSDAADLLDVLEDELTRFQTALSRQILSTDGG
jgi:HPt (histidine-containing phosphotransfer) domain-containing protein